MRTFTQLLSHVDLHVALLLVLLLPAVLLPVPALWPCLGLALLPQGILITHFADLRRNRHGAFDTEESVRAKRTQSFAYLCMNELFVLIVVLLVVALSWQRIISHS